MCYCFQLKKKKKEKRKKKKIALKLRFKRYLRMIIECTVKLKTFKNWFDRNRIASVHLPEPSPPLPT